ncbi:MAG: LiaF domain-containing protein, partial [Acidimicrobiales bacterium]
ILGLALVMTTVAGSSVGAVAVIGTGLAVVGLLMIISAFVGRTARLVPLAVLLLLLLPAAPIIDQAISDGVGTTDVALSSVDNLASSYRQGVGELRLDLSRLEITEDTPVEAVIGTGSMVIIVPSETAVELRAATTIGSVAALGRERAGIGSSLDIQPPPSVDSDAPRLILDVSATIGSVEVYRGRTIVADGE